MSQGQAMRSTWAFSRVIHFTANSPVLFSAASRRPEFLQHLTSSLELRYKADAEKAHRAMFSHQSLLELSAPVSTHHCAAGRRHPKIPLRRKHKVFSRHRHN